MMLLSSVKKRQQVMKMQSKLDLVKDDAELSSEEEYVANKNIKITNKAKLINNS